MPIVSVLVAVGCALGLFRVDRRRLVLVTVLVLTAAALTLVQLLLGAMPSLLSFALLIVLYAPAVLTPKADAVAYRAVGRFFVRLMGVAAVVSVVQLVVQAAGLPWRDWLAQVVPAQLLLADFNTGNPISYGASIDRATAVVFLEPSFLSLLLGVAVVVALRLRLGWKPVTLLLVGIVPTVAGNGLVVVGLAIVVWFFSRSRGRLLELVPAGVLAVAVAALTPLGAVFLARSTEGGGEDSSTGLRLVQPYVQLVPPSLQDALHALVGHGAGAASDYIARTTTQPLLATAFPKVLFEFGLIGVVGVLLPLLILLASPLRRQPELIGLVAAFFVVNASLLTPLTVYLVVLLLLWMPDMAERGSGREDLADIVEQAPAPRLEPVG